MVEVELSPAAVLPSLVVEGVGGEGQVAGLSEHGRSVLSFVEKQAVSWFQPPTEGSPSMVDQESISAVFGERAEIEKVMPVLEAVQARIRDGLLEIDPSGADMERLYRKVAKALGVDIGGIDERNLARFEGDVSGFIALQKEKLT
jgi:hypothetical protein